MTSFCKFYKLKLIILFTISFLFLLNDSVQSQFNGNGIFFQALARDNYSNPAKDRKIFVLTSILQNSNTGDIVLQEVHETLTDAAGVFSITLGQGIKVGGSAINLSNVPWSTGQLFLNIKIAINPLAPIENWDYTKNLVELGTTPFGIVPYALYAGSVANFDTKLNIADTANMLNGYARISNLNSLSNNKLSVTDTANMLAAYARVANLNALLNNKINLSDSTLVFVTPTQLNAKTFDSTSLVNSIHLKANNADLITLTNNVNSNTASITAHVNLISTHTNYINTLTSNVNSNTSSITYNTNSINNLTNNINAHTASITTNTNNIELKANIASPNFTGTVNGISKAMVGLGNVDNTNDANKPISAATQLVLDAKELLENKSVSIATDAGSDIKYPSVKSVKNYVDAQILGATIADADATTKGKLQLAGDLTGTAAAPVVANNAITSAKISDANIITSKIADGNITTAKILDANITDAKILNVNGSKIIGSTLASNIVISNLSSVGTITTGVWSGTTIANTVGGAGNVNGILKANGLGVVNAAINATDYSVVREITDEYTATAGQTSFTLSQTKSVNSVPKMFVNGIRISNTAYTISGNTLTYIPANNGANILSVNDRIQIDYYY